MADTNYPIPPTPVYDDQIRQLQDTDPAKASTVFNPLFQKIIENTAALKIMADDAEQAISDLESNSGNAANADTAKKLDPGAKINGVTIIGDGNDEILPLRSVTFGSSTDTGANVWYKIAERTVTAGEICVLTLHITHTRFGSSVERKKSGILKFGFTAASPITTGVRDAVAIWEYANGIDIEDCVAAYSPISGSSSATFELWARVSGATNWATATILSEVQNNVITKLPLFTLHDRPAGQADITAGLTRVPSRMGAYTGEYNPAWTSPLLTIDEAIDYIASMAKFVNRSITIRVLPGESAREMVIDRFYGPGVLNVYAVDSVGTTVTTMGVETHKMSLLKISNCTCQQINIQGITSTATTGNAFDYSSSTGVAYFRYCNAVAGSSATPNFIGVRSYYSPGMLQVANCTLSNKAYATYSNRGLVDALSNDGSSNNYVFAVSNAGIIGIFDNQTMSGANRYIRSSGGVIINYDGIPIDQISGTMLAVPTADSATPAETASTPIKSLLQTIWNKLKYVYETLSTMATTLSGKVNTVDYNSTVSSMQTALGNKANTTHQHNTSDIASGTLPVERGGTGSTQVAGSSGVLSKLFSINMATTMTHVVGITSGFGSSGSVTMAELKALLGIKITERISGTATLPIGGWTNQVSSNGYYYIDVAMAGMLATDMPKINIKKSFTDANADDLMEASWNKVAGGVAQAGSVRFRCKELPTVAVTLEWEAIR